MKLFGTKIVPPEDVTVLIPRQSGNIIFKARAVLNTDQYEVINPLPKPPQMLEPGDTQGVNGVVKTSNPNDPAYLDKINKWSSSQMDWLFLESLKATEQLEWETVDINKPDTYVHIREELQASGFSPVQIARIYNIVYEANGLTQDRIDEATRLFLAGKGQTQNGLWYQNGVPSTTQSGEPANDSESDPQE